MVDHTWSFYDLSTEIKLGVKKTLFLNFFSFNTLTAEGFSQTGPFTHLSNHVFPSQ